jgi:hypothetical protein
MADPDWKTALLSKLSELFCILLALVGVVIVVVAITKGIKIKDWWSLSVPDSISPISRALLAAFGLLVMAVGLYLRKTELDTAPIPDAKDYGIKISYPQSGSKVGNVDVGGTIKKALPSGFSLWVFRVYDDGRFYPLRQCMISENGDTWVAPNCDPGGKSRDKRWFSVNLVGRDGSALISFVGEAVQRITPVREELAALTGKDVPYLPGVPKHTRDMVPCDSIRIERL